MNVCVKLDLQYLQCALSRAENRLNGATLQLLRWHGCHGEFLVPSSVCQAANHEHAR